MGWGKNPSALHTKAENMQNINKRSNKIYTNFVYLPGPDLGVVGGAGVVTDEDVPLEFEMDLLDSSLLGSDGLLGFGALQM